jgi:hypothetical protein
LLSLGRIFGKIYSKTEIIFRIDVYKIFHVYIIALLFHCFCELLNI